MAGGNHLGLPISWRLVDKNVLIVGGGDVAAGRLDCVLDAGAKVTLVAPNPLHPDIIRRIQSTSPGRITHFDRIFEHSDLEGMDIALTAINDVSASEAICAQCRAVRIPINVADIPPSCDFFFGSQIRRGPLQIMVSTNGNAPRLARIIRQKIEGALPENVGDAITNVGILRTKLRARAPGVGGDLGKRRMQWMTSVCEAWSMDDLAQLNETDMNRLLDEGWQSKTVPPPRLRSFSWGPTSVSLPVLSGFTVGVLCTTAVIILLTKLSKQSHA